MKDPWLNFQYTIEFADDSDNGVCSVLSINANGVKHGTTSFITNPVRGQPVRCYAYSGTYTEPITISILLGQGARPWLKWFSEIQNKKKPKRRNVTISLYSYGQSRDNSQDGQLWLRWDLINAYPSSWQIGSLAVEDSPSPMKIDMTLQFESMVILDGDNEMHEVMG